ncbi:MAG: hypothetical protein NZZ60_06310 [Bacteroidia bacterium]|nr:hypothetical protein [Bacteroidia bacterium]MDW8416318.1 hypothetical protein [Bacteroidia bacterium]
MSSFTRFLAVISHPVFIEVAYIAYWSHWHVGWVMASFSILVLISGLLYLWLLRGKRDIIALLGSERRFMLLWHLLAVVGLWGAVTDPVLYIWLSFFIWMSFWGFLLHWKWEYSFHTYGWAGMSGFYTGYVTDHLWPLLFFLGGTVAIAWLRYAQKAHNPTEIWRGGVMGWIVALGYVGFHTLMG